MSEQPSKTRAHSDATRPPAAATEPTPGVFRPAPGQARAGRLFVAQARIETVMFLRHGEQQLLSIVIPLGILLGLAFLPIEWPLSGGDPIAQFFPLALAIAATSSGFTGQAIALAFDRRYGALKRTGASGVPAWAIVMGKAAAVAVITILQTLILGATAVALGWRTDAVGMVAGLVTLILGAAAFTALGLLMGGTLSSEVVLGLANLVWAVLLAAIGFVLYTQGLDHFSGWDLIPSVALASGLTVAFSGAIPWAQWLILAAWCAGGTALAVRWFKFSG
ncbi:multidrug ABC transporter permease [Corynebacterium atypicum]|uniref:Multidrug ABC transporter permease n=1 Tax=Corynebacterium atypicum TaxID=191610 RepID=A0ABM5QMW1_9CORY|nr:ABC transporter permease [Corynebacterium atypicum]AIG64098.1 multidrug ABC transporter permease [Corynebacterium atypicum]